MRQKIAANYYQPTYWNNVGAHQKLYDNLYAQLVPTYGKAPTHAGELLRAISRIYYDLYNNGWGNGPWTWAAHEIYEHRDDIKRAMSNPSNFNVFWDIFAATDFGKLVVNTEEAPFDFPEPEDDFSKAVEEDILTLTNAELSAIDDVVDGVVQVVSDMATEANLLHAPVV